MRNLVASGQSGAALLEAVAAGALVAAVIATNTSALATAARALEASSRRWSMQSLARNALEIEAAAACSNLQACPEPFDCTVSRHGTGMPGVLLLRSTVADKTDGAATRVSFAMLVRRASPCAT